MSLHEALIGIRSYAWLLGLHIVLVIVRNQFLVKLSCFEHSARSMLDGLTIDTRHFRRDLMTSAKSLLITAILTKSSARHVQTSVLRLISRELTYSLNWQICRCLQSLQVTSVLAGIKRSPLVIIFRFLYLNLNPFILHCIQWRNASRQRNSCPSSICHTGSVAGRFDGHYTVVSRVTACQASYILLG